MEASLYFSAFVLAMCALHLIWTASGRLDAWWRDNVPHAKKGSTESGRAPQRGDWYVFFHCSDLVGQETVAGKASPDTTGRKMTERKPNRLPRATAC